MTAAVLTVSTSLAAGEGEDVSGPALVELCEDAGLEVVHETVPDDRETISAALKRLAAMRAFMRERNLGGEADAALASEVGLDVDELERMYRLLAIAKFNERYVIPQGHSEVAGRLVERQGGGGFQSPLGPGPNGGNLVPLEQFGKGK